MYNGNISTASNRADWQETCVLTDVDTGDPIDISLCTITMTVATAPRIASPPGAYGRYDYGGPILTGTSYAVPILTGSTDTGEITVVDLGTFEWLFPAPRMAILEQGVYQVGIRISQDERIVQLIAGTVSVIEGVDMQ